MGKRFMSMNSMRRLHTASTHMASLLLVKKLDVADAKPGRILSLERLGRLERLERLERCERRERRW